MRAVSKDEYTQIANLRPGTRFITAFGRSGTLERVGPGSATVIVDRQTSKTFTPKTGRHKGEEVLITQERERTQWSLATMVLPEER